RKKKNNYKERYKHLNISIHNYLRITRILKCCSEMGKEELNLGFLLNIIYEIENKNLNINSIGKSARDYWFVILRNKKLQRILKNVLIQGKDNMSMGKEGIT